MNLHELSSAGSWNNPLVYKYLRTRLSKSDNGVAVFEARKIIKRHKFSVYRSVIHIYGS